MICCSVGAITLGFLLQNVNAAPPLDYTPPDDFGVGDGSDSNEWPTLPDHLCTTVILPNRTLRGVPQDIKEFWGDMYVYVSVVWVLGLDLCKQINICDKMNEKINPLINRTTEMVEAEIKIILNNDSDWSTRKESTAEYQIACAEKLTTQWHKIEDAWEEEMKNRNPYEQKILELRETRHRFREVKRDLARRIKDLKQAVEKQKSKTSYRIQA